MKQSANTDMQCIERMLKHIGSIKSAFKALNIALLEDFLKNDVCQLAVTQAITNIYELRKKLRIETLDKLTKFSHIRLHAARNIASHDYERLDFEIIYRRANQLLREEIIAEMEDMIDELEDDKPSD